MPGQYVGLRNGGATCYMNAVFQQLFMQPTLRTLVLQHRSALHDVQSDVAVQHKEKERKDSLLFQVQVRIMLMLLLLLLHDAAYSTVDRFKHNHQLLVAVFPLPTPTHLNASIHGCMDAKRDHHNTHTQPPIRQSLFAALALSNETIYEPDGFWAAFKDYDGEPVNLREHQDAYEFFTRLQVCWGRFLTEGSPVQGALPCPRI